MHADARAVATQIVRALYVYIVGLFVPMRFWLWRQPKLPYLSLHACSVHV